MHHHLPTFASTLNSLPPSGLQQDTFNNTTNNKLKLHYMLITQKLFSINLQVVLN